MVAVNGDIRTALLPCLFLRDFKMSVAGNNPIYTPRSTATVTSHTAVS